MSNFVLVLLASMQVSLPASPEEEIELALSAAPPAAREDAGVYVLGSDGYVLAREGKSGLTCLVERGPEGSLEPICWDAEGAETLLPVALEKARLRAQGKTEDDVSAHIADGYASGRFRAPRRAGVAYMLSTENHVWNGERIVRYHPHVMVYAPYVTNADIGSDGMSPWMPWVLNEGEPNAYIITVVRADDDGK